MTLFEQFIRNFGKWSVVESCKVKDLPFIGEIKRFLDEVEKRGIAAGEVSDSLFAEDGPEDQQKVSY